MEMGFSNIPFETMREISTAPAEPSTPTPTQKPLRSTQLNWMAAIAALLAFAICYLRTFVLPHIPMMFWTDQMLYATNGTRLLSGQMPYRDYFEFLTPGTDWTYALLFRIFGVSLWIPNLLMDLLASIAVLLTTLAAGKVLRGVAVVLPAAFFLGLGLYGGLDATHHWFSALTAMVVLLHGTETRHLLAAGTLCGVAASFTQSKGAFVTLGFMVYLLWQSVQQREPIKALWRKYLLLCGAALAGFLPFNLYYMVKLGFSEWYRWIVTFSLRYYPTMPGQNLRAPLDDFQGHSGLKWICVPFLYVAVPVIYLSYLPVMRRNRRREPEQPWEQLLLIAITGMAMYLGITPSISIIRTSAVCLPATILLAWLLERATGRMRYLRPVLAALSLACALRMAYAMQRTHWQYLDLPAGRSAIQERGRYDLYLWMKEHTRPGEPYLGIGPISFPLRLYCPSPIQQPAPWEYYRPEHISRAIQAMETYRIPLIVHRPYERFRHIAGYNQELIQPFEDYLHRHYRRIETFSTGDEVWERIDDPR